MKRGRAPCDDFRHLVAESFGLGRQDEVRVTPMKGSANRLWKFESDGGTFVVKELTHEALEDLPGRRAAAAFEKCVFDAGKVLMPEPVVAADGEIVCPLTGSRGSIVPVRVHRWLDGRPLDRPGCACLVEAGRSLAAIQEVGRQVSRESTGTLAWWDTDPPAVLERLRTGPAPSVDYEDARAAIREALDVVEEGEALPGDWVFTHCDHKPDNSLDVDGRPAVLDWDECGCCHPRLEAVEAALRWAGEAQAGRRAFEAFLEGYSAAGGDAADLEPRDFAKWLAALVGWFAYQARRAMGDWEDENEAEREAAMRMALDTLRAIRPTLEKLPVWSGWG